MSNITQNIILRGDSVGTVSVGFSGERASRQIDFDFTKWQETYGAGALQLLFQRPAEKKPYPVALSIDGAIASWVPNEADTEICGQAKAQLIYTVNGAVAKTAIFSVVIQESLGTETDPPDPYETWLTTLVRLGAETLENAQAARSSADAAAESASQADHSADAAFQSESNAKDSEIAAKASEEAAAAQALDASRSAATATGAATTAQNYATTAAGSATSAASSASEADASRVAAASAAQTANQAAITANSAAGTASAQATAAAGSAATAAQKASDASASAASAASSASAAGGSATSASGSAAAAAGSASNASASADRAQSIVDDAEADIDAAKDSAVAAVGAAGTAAVQTVQTEGATQTANAKAQADAASASATAAAGSASSASASATAAGNAQTAAETAQGKAEDAQEAAETAAQSIEDSAAQIDTNTADILNLKSALNTKAGILRDTVSGSVASFTPDATIPDLLGVSVAVEPIQDLHGYDSPWPAGGGDNLLPDTGLTAESYGVKSVYANGRMTITGLATGSGGRNALRTPNFSLKAGTYYFRKFQATGTLAPTVQVQNGSTIIGYASGSFTLESDSDSINIGFNVSSGNDYDYSVLLMVSSSEPSKWTPYSNICPISGWDAVEVNAAGINVWDEEWEIGSYSATGQKVATQGLRIRSVNMIPIMPNTSYYMTGGVYLLCQYAKDGTFISFTQLGSDASSNTGHTVTTSADTYFVTFATYQQYGTTYNHDISINYPSTDTTYHPYAGNRYTIQLGQTVYGGTLDVDAGTLTVDRAMVDMGTLSWSYDGTRATFNALINPMKNNGALVCSAYKWNNRPNIAPSALNDMEISASPFYASHRLMVKNHNYNNSVSFATAVSGVQLVYELATPIVIDLDPVQITAIANQTNNVWADAGDVTVEFAADLKTYIDSKIAAAVAAMS